MRIKPFVEREPRVNPAEAIHENPVLDRVYRNRGIGRPSDIDYELTGLLSPFDMKGMQEATDRIIEHIKRGSRILIVGDYDCDGATATTIAVEGLEMLGAKDVSFLVPDRMKHGYGLSPKVVDVAAEARPDLIITVDNGIASFDGAQAVRNLAHPCDLIITDHHLPSDRGVPDAEAIINPSQQGCPFASKAIAGCGVMFYTIMGLRAKMRGQGVFTELGIAEPRLTSLLDVLALGTIADVVPLDKNNRILVNTGIEAINAGLVRPGLRAILELGKRRVGDIVTTDMGFCAGPRLNAAGRLDDMGIGIRCLLSRNEAEAGALAEQLDDFNRRRKEMESEMVDEAVASYENFTTDRYGVCLVDPHWHEGVVGIVASRIKDRLSRPVICFSYSEPARELNRELQHARRQNEPDSRIRALEAELGDLDMKGSARSVPGVHMKHVLDHINKSHPDILQKFGGHAMAAGMSIKIKDFEAFRDHFDALVSQDLTEEMIQGKVEVDIKDIDPEWMTLETAELLRHAEPWGQHFDPPRFSANFELVDYRVLQDKHMKMTLRPLDSEQQFEAIAFNCVEKGQLPVRYQVEASFSLDVNEWRGVRKLQLLIEHIQDEKLVLELEKAREEQPGKAVLAGAGTCEHAAVSAAAVTPDPGF